MTRACLRSILFACLAVTAGAAMGCSHAEPTRIPYGLHSPFTGYRSETYQDPRMWICRPDLPNDACRGDLTATEIRIDGTRTIVPQHSAAAPAVDCFYVYPTVDYGWFAGNHTNFSDVQRIADAVRAQAALFSQVCAVYAPLYRQVTLGTYRKSSQAAEPYLAVAESDIADAFLHYMGQYNRGRKVVLIGHSQGAEMIGRLLQRFFDNDPLMREQLLLAMPIGGRVEVPVGRRSGGTFAHLEPCSRPEQQGCFLAYRSHSAARPVDPGDMAPSPGRQTVCVNPADVAGNAQRPLNGTAVPVSPELRRHVPELRDVETPFVVLPGLYAAHCADVPDGYRYLAISAARLPGETRRNPIDLDSWIWTRSLGLHVLDFQLPLGELVGQVRVRAASAALSP